MTRTFYMNATLSLASWSLLLTASCAQAPNSGAPVANSPKSDAETHSVDGAEKQKDEGEFSLACIPVPGPGVLVVFNCIGGGGGGGSVTGLPVTQPPKCCKPK
jgi:hypothetical protein